MIEVLELIKKAESNYYKILCSEIEKEFSSVWLPSHNLEHHKRVWRFAKEILMSYAKSGFSFSYNYIEALMFSAFFHDVGLTRTIDFEHGVESAELAKACLNKISDNSNPYIQEMLEAIEKHDDKEYLNVNVESGANPKIYSILTVADDLDAFGAIGLYRYFEIYFLRGISIKEIPEAIKRNLNKRFEFVSSILLFDPDLHKEHLKRYKKAVNILLELKQSSLQNLSNIISEKRELVNIPMESTIYDMDLQSFASELRLEYLSAIN